MHVHTCMHACMYAHTRTHACMRTRTHTQIHVQKLTCMDAPFHTCMLPWSPSPPTPNFKQYDPLIVCLTTIINSLLVYLRHPCPYKIKHELLQAGNLPSVSPPRRVREEILSRRVWFLSVKLKILPRMVPFLKVVPPSLSSCLSMSLIIELLPTPDSPINYRHHLYKL